jgi:hypothetical protein
VGGEGVGTRSFLGAYCHWPGIYVSQSQRARVDLGCLRAECRVVSFQARKQPGISLDDDQRR